MKILLIEDDLWLAELHQDVLSAAGHHVTHCLNAEAALAQLDQQTDIALVVLDIYLPDHNGVEFLHEIASYSDSKQLRVLILSSVPERDFMMDEERWKHYGVVGHLYKPATKPQQLVSAVEKQLATRSY